MSFGKSADVRFDAQGAGKKPLVFWDHQQSQAQKPKKKFNYKTKGNNIPLRDKTEKEELEPTRTVKPQHKRALIKPEVGTKTGAVTQKPSVKHQNGKTTTNNKGRPTDKKPVPDDKVTLTQSQFDKILETIGELTLLAEEKEHTDAPGTNDSLDLNIAVDVNESVDPSVEAPVTQPINNQNLAPGAAVPKLDITSPRYYDPRAVPEGPVTGNTRSSLIGVPFAHMTKAERKRLEWERQKAEDAAIQKQVHHTEKLHATGGGIGQQHQPPQQPGAQATAHQPIQTAPQTLSQNIPAMTGSSVNPSLQQSEGNNPPVAQNQSPYITTQPTVNSIPGLSQPRDFKQQNEPNARVVSRSSVVVNEPASVPGLNVSSENQPSQSSAPKTTVHIEPQTVPGLQMAQTQPSNVAAQPAPSQPVQPQVATRGPMTKAELKRLQWNKEKAEIDKQQEWDPWGKPGAGAPIKDDHGNVLADFSTRKEEAIRQSFEDVSRRNQTQQYQQQAQPQYQPQTQGQQSVGQPPQPNLPVVMHQPAPTAVQQPQANGGVIEAPPAAIRSSFNVGAIAPDENKYMSAKEQQRRQWLADLEKQREEQRMRKLQQKQRDTDIEMKDMGYKDYRPNGVPDQHVQQVPAQISHSQLPPAQPTYAAATSVQQPQNTQPGVYQQPHTQPAAYQQPHTQPASYQQPAPSQNPQAFHAGPLPSGEPSQPQTDTFLRGQNVNVDEVTRREQEDKRKKQLEYQEYIKQQITEKERQKKEEAERKRREDNEMEQKLQRERDELQNINKSEHDKARQREESDRRRAEQLKSAMDQEKERADWEKHEKRMLKLRQGGHDIAGYHATFQSKHTPRDGAASTLTVAPSYIPGLGAIPSHRDNAPSQMNSYPSPIPAAVAEPYADMRSMAGAEVRGSQQYGGDQQQYTENRVLTPSAYRAPKKEFGVQTDPLTLESLSRESTDIEYKGPIKKKVRVKSAAELKALKLAREKKKGFGSSVARPTDPPKSAPVSSAAAKSKPMKPILKKTYKKPVPVNRRPAWGSGSAATNKKVVKQSERDPFYEEKRKQSEERGLLRQQMLLEMAEQETPLVYNKSTAAVRARSKSRGREEDEFEAPGAVHVSTTKVMAGSRQTGKDSSTGHRSRVDSRSDRGYSSQRSNSPPVPALKNRITAGDVTDSGRGTPASSRRKTPSDYNADPYNYESYSRTDNRVDAGSRAEGNHNKKYSDTVVQAPVQNGHFVPFIRSTNILDPANAEEPLPMSREPSTMQRARQAYVQEHEPAKYGTAMENFNDSRIMEDVPVQAPPKYNKDPIINPSVVKDHPSQRQNRILQQLSDLRKGLMQKQRELEVGLLPEEVVG